MPEVSAWNDPLVNVAMFGFDGTKWRWIRATGEGYFRIDLWTRAQKRVGHPDWHWDRYSDVAENEDLPAGDSTLSLTAIDSGDIVVVQAVMVQHVSDTISRLVIWLYDGANFFPILDQLNPTSDKWHTVSGPFDLKAGDQITVKVYDATLNDNVYLRAWGRKIQD